MSGDDENRFEPRPGAIRSDSPKAGKAKSFLTRAKTLARKHSNRPARGAARSPSGISRVLSKASGKGVKAAGRRAEGAGVRRGRGAAFVRARSLSGGWRHSAPGMRRVVVKTRYVRQAGRSGKGAAHLRYIQRDGTSRDGAPGRLYSATEDQADGEAFLARGRDDRHQFRFIIAPEDAADPRFRERVLPPPDLRNRSVAVGGLRPSDDWSSLMPADVSTQGEAVDHPCGDPANAGIRREPELPEQEEIVPAPSVPVQEFDLLDDEPDVDAAQARAIRQRMRMVARQVAMNPDDGIEL